MTVLSQMPDGFGFFYGFRKGDARRIDVKQDTPGHWAAWVGGMRIAAGRTKEEAESMALGWMDRNPAEPLPE